MPRAKSAKPKKSKVTKAAKSKRSPAKKAVVKKTKAAKPSSKATKKAKATSGINVIAKLQADFRKSGSKRLCVDRSNIVQYNQFL